MDYTVSRNNWAVQEVVRFVLSNGVLTQPYQGAHVTWSTETVHDAKQLDRYRDPDARSALIEGIMAYMDIKREWARQVSTRPLPYSSDDLGILHKLCTQLLYPHLVNQHSELLPVSELNEILADLEEVMLFRTSFGVTANPYEDLFSIYVAGGFPCGWIGSYPNGKLAVFSIS
ncbi:MAG: hypothetical protein KDA52_15810 [Planctomycetaceae bacterium]|nr:hypothetical protein [Planctomycetaceae bacterium]